MTIREYASLPSATVFSIVLEYCGGSRTDRLVEMLARWNPGHSINVLDNASPRNPCSYITHRNARNTFVGGGIRDCLKLAGAAGARFLLFIANDIECRTPLYFSRFEEVALTDERIVLVSASISHDTTQARIFPWMVAGSTTDVRLVPQADFLVSLIDVNFVSSFGGFPPSKGGWGYCWEFAYHANLQSKNIAVLDDTVIYHDAAPREGDPAEILQQKAEEAQAVYRMKYGKIPWLRLY